MTAGDPYASLRQVLEREYRLERVVQENEEGAVYLARDLALERHVLIKAVDPALAGEARTEAFRREARVLAAVNHAGVPAVHHAGAIGGLLYVVLEDPGAETLDQRLSRGALGAPEVVRLGDQLLSALAAVHAAGLAHREVDARHVVMAGDRYVLGGFASAGPATGSNETAADVRAAALLLARAAGGTRRDLRGRLPASVRSVLPPRLSLEPVERWRSAAELRTALLGPRGRRRSSRASWIVAALVLLLATGYLMRDRIRWTAGRLAPPPRELAIVPFAVAGGQPLDPLGTGFAPLLELNLDGLPDLELTPRREVDRWWKTVGRDPLGIDWAEAARDLRVHWVAHGLVYRRRGDTLGVQLTIYDSLGARRVLSEVSKPARDLAALGDSLTLQIVRVVAPRADDLYEPVAGLASVPLPALKAFLQGEAAFAQDAWSLAQRQYEIALGHDSTFALAEWRLANVKRWRRLPYEPDLRELYLRHGSRLRPRDRLLIEALLEPDLEVRLTKLAAAVGQLRTDAYARLLQGEELFHRGPLVGHSLDEAVRALDAAVAQDSSLALAYDHLVLAATRFGRRDQARAALALRSGLTQPAHPDDLDLVPFLRLVYDERFEPWRAWLRRRIMTWRADPRQLAALEKVVRMGTPWLDMPRTQVRYCDLLLQVAERSAETYATAYEGKGLALYALGRSREALAALDSAAALLDAPEARLQQAEWRVVPSALGLPEADGGDWSQRLEELAADSVLGARAAWALALAAQSEGDTTRFRRWAERLEAGTPLRVLLEAREAALLGDPAQALARSHAVRIAFQDARPPDAFAGAAFHLLRGDWLAAMGDRGRADGEWLWYEASEVEGWPGGLAQANEVDAALGGFARLRRARNLLAAGATRDDTLRACGHLARLLKLWSEADSTVQPQAREAASLAERCPR